MSVTGIGAALKDAQRRRSSLPFVTEEQKDPRAFYFTQEYRNHHVVLHFLPGEPDFRILKRHRVRMNRWTYRDEICRDGCPVCAFEDASGQPLGDVKVRLLTNIVILEDTLHPENVGKVFLYECGEQIAQMVDTQLTAVGVNVFDLKTGHPFWLEATWRSNGTPVYRNTAGFCDPSPLPPTFVVDTILEARYDLNDYPRRNDEDLMNSFRRLRVSVEEYRSMQNQQLTGTYA